MNAEPDDEPLLGGQGNSAPRDRYNVVYIIFYLLGLGSLLPWNFFITAKGYFQYKLRNTTLPADVDYNDPKFETEHQIMFETYMAMAAQIPNLIFNFKTALLVRKISLKKRMVGSMVFIIAVFVITSVFTKINSDKWQLAFFAFTMVEIVLLNGASAVFCASTFGLSGMFPTRYIQATMTGQGMGGTFAALVNILAISSRMKVVDSALAFFLCAVVTSVLTLCGYIALYFINFSRFYLVEQAEFITEIINSDDSLERKTHHGCTYFIKIFKKIWMDGLGEFITFFVTLACFPAICSSIFSMNRDKSSIWSDEYFIPVVCFLLFNIGDWAGRIVAGWIHWPGPRSKGLLLFVCLLRIGFIPLLMYCNAQPRSHSEVFFTSDVYPVVFILLLGLTNGQLSTVCMMYGPRRVAPDHAETAGAMMSLFLTLGLTFGSLLSMLLMKLL
ncbi:hypothetical protein ScPMuIL_013932 [Solemya velum]